MKKLICITALAAITLNSVYAAPVQQNTQDTTKAKKKVKGDKGKIKMKGDTSKARHHKIDSVK